MYYFISDIHLGLLERSDNQKIEDLLLDFLDYIQKDCQKLFILGDLFDYWFEYSTVVPARFYRTLNKFYDLTKIQMPITYLMGNHDFGHRSFFKKEFGIDVHENDIIEIIHGKKFYLSHGDGKAHNDTGYKILKKILRNPVSKSLFKLIHPDLGIRTAMSSSKTSRGYTDKKDYGLRDGMRDFAKHKIEREGFDYVIMGHRHKHEFTRFGSGAYINLGHWLSEEPTFAYFDGNDIMLDLVKNYISR